MIPSIVCFWLTGACQPLEDALLDGGIPTDGGSTNDVSEFSGTISANTTWTRATCPVTLIGDVYVQGPSSPKLTIEPGCEVRVKSGFGIYVAYNGEPGALSAIGTAELPIIFTAAGAREPGSWSGISLDDQTVDSATRLAFVTIEFAGGSFLEGGIDVDNASPTIEDSTFRSNDGYGIYLGDGAGLGPSSARITATSNQLYGIHVGAGEAHTIPENGSYTGNVVAGVEIAGGGVASSATWGGINDRYVISGDIYVQGPASPVLTITEGAILAFGADRGVYVAYNGQPGALSVQGTGTSPVTFTAHRQPQRGAWSGISFDDNSVDATNRIANAVIEYAGGAFLDGCVDIDSAIVTIDGVRIQNCDGDGLRFANGGAFGDTSRAVTATSNALSGVAIEAGSASTVPSASSDYSGNTVAGVDITGGGVGSSGTWRAQSVPVLVSGDIYVQGPARPVLTLEAGLELEFRADRGFYVAYNGEAGGLMALGTASAPIVFSAFDQQVKGHWSGISFDDNTIDASAMLDHVVVEWAGGAFLSGDVDVENARVTISNSTLWRSAGCGVSATCSAAGQGPMLTNIDYGTGADANDGGNACLGGC